MGFEVIGWGYQDDIAVKAIPLGWPIRSQW